MITACLNGSRRPDEHPSLPLTPQELARAAVRAVDAGAGALHIHPRDNDGSETLVPDRVAAAVEAVRAAVPGVSISVTTGAWIEADPAARLRSISKWGPKPDFASVNWHEPGAEELAGVLLGEGVSVEAGLWNGVAALAFARSPLAASCQRILLEPMESNFNAALTNAQTMAATVAPLNLPILLHGIDGTAWPMLRYAAQQGFDMRIGLEDVCDLPDGTPARENAELVAMATLIAKGWESSLA